MVVTGYALAAGVSQESEHLATAGCVQAKAVGVDGDEGGSSGMNVPKYFTSPITCINGA